MADILGPQYLFCTSYYLCSRQASFLFRTGQKHGGLPSHIQLVERNLP